MTYLAVAVEDYLSAAYGECIIPYAVLVQKTICPFCEGYARSVYKVESVTCGRRIQSLYLCLKRCLFQTAQSILCPDYCISCLFYQCKSASVRSLIMCQSAGPAFDEISDLFYGIIHLSGSQLSVFVFHFHFDSFPAGVICHTCHRICRYYFFDNICMCPYVTYMVCYIRKVYSSVSLAGSCRYCTGTDIAGSVLFICFESEVAIFQCLADQIFGCLEIEYGCACERVSKLGNSSSVQNSSSGSRAFIICNFRFKQSVFVGIGNFYCCGIYVTGIIYIGVASGCLCNPVIECMPCIILIITDGAEIHRTVCGIFDGLAPGIASCKSTAAGICRLDPETEIVAAESGVICLMSAQRCSSCSVIFFIIKFDYILAVILYYCKFIRTAVIAISGQRALEIASGFCTVIDHSLSNGLVRASYYGCSIRSKRSILYICFTVIIAVIILDRIVGDIQFRIFEIPGLLSTVLVCIFELSPVVGRYLCEILSHIACQIIYIKLHIVCKGIFTCCKVAVAQRPFVCIGSRIIFCFLAVDAGRRRNGYRIAGISGYCLEFIFFSGHCAVSHGICDNCACSCSYILDLCTYGIENALQIA